MSFKILKIHSEYTKEIDSPDFDIEATDVSNYLPHIKFLSKIDQNYWWHPDRARAVEFATRQDAAAAIDAYRKHQGDPHSLMKIVKA